jgi:hypothetical protein
MTINIFTFFLCLSLSLHYLLKNINIKYEFEFFL